MVYYSGKSNTTVAEGTLKKKKFYHKNNAKVHVALTFTSHIEKSILRVHRVYIINFGKVDNPVGF